MLMHVRVEKLSKSFGSKKVLDNVSLDVESKSFFTILGPTGHGKTTLLRIIAGVETPDEGKVYFDRKDVTDMSPQKREVSMVYQDFALYRNMNVYNNIASPLRVSREKLSPKEIDKKVREKAKMLGLENLLDRDTTELSGGEQQRTALARALAKESDLILLDEPLTNLDYKLREEMRRRLKSIKFGTVIHATSEPLTALACCTHVAVIMNGRILQQGESRNVYSYPKNTAVGGYFSYPPMNFLDAKLTKENGKNYIKASKELKLEVSHMKDMLDADQYILGIRAGELVTGKEKRGMLSITPTVKLVESKGSESVVHLDYMGSNMMMYTLGVVEYKIEQELKLFINPEEIYIFEEKSKNCVTKYQKTGESKK